MYTHGSRAAVPIARYDTLASTDNRGERITYLFLFVFLPLFLFFGGIILITLSFSADCFCCGKCSCDKSSGEQSRKEFQSGITYVTHGSRAAVPIARYDDTLASTDNRCECITYLFLFVFLRAFPLLRRNRPSLCSYPSQLTASVVENVVVTSQVVSSSRTEISVRYYV